MTTIATDARPSFGEAFLLWLKIGCINFGGPAGQIALMHRILVDEKKWVDEAAFPARVEFLHAPARPRGAKARNLSGLASARRAWRPQRRHSVRSAGRVCDARLEPALRARPRHPADRRRLVRHQGGGAGDRDRGAVPHRQTRAQVVSPSRSGRSGVRRHLLFDAAVSADRGRSGARRLRRCAHGHRSNLGFPEKQKTCCRRTKIAGANSPSHPPSASLPG